MSVTGVVRDVKALLDEDDGPEVDTPRLPGIPDILTKEDVLALCLAAVGHDAGHPGLTNAFMVRYSLVPQ